MTINVSIFPDSDSPAIHSLDFADSASSDEIARWINDQEPELSLDRGNLPFSHLVKVVDFARKSPSARASVCIGLHISIWPS